MISLENKMVYYIDCEFDGHNGPLLSIAMVAQNGYAMHLQVREIAQDPWVIKNVMPVMPEHEAEIHRYVNIFEVGEYIRAFIGCDTNDEITIVADSPVDISRFCRALTTNEKGEWESTSYPELTLRVHNIDCYPTNVVGAVQHNAYWDAMALRAKLFEEYSVA
jgi:hypothetical protein